MFLLLRAIVPLARAVFRSRGLWEALVSSRGFCHALGGNGSLLNLAVRMRRVCRILRWAYFGRKVSCGCHNNCRDKGLHTSGA